MITCWFNVAFSLLKEAEGRFSRDWQRWAAQRLHSMGIICLQHRQPYSTRYENIQKTALCTAFATHRGEHAEQEGVGVVRWDSAWRWWEPPLMWQAMRHRQILRDKCCPATGWHQSAWGSFPPIFRGTGALPLNAARAMNDRKLQETSGKSTKLEGAVCSELAGTVIPGILHALPQKEIEVGSMTYTLKKLVTKKKKILKSQQ